MSAGFADPRRGSGRYYNGAPLPDGGDRDSLPGASGVEERGDSAGAGADRQAAADSRGDRTDAATTSGGATATPRPSYAERSRRVDQAVQDAYDIRCLADLILEALGQEDHREPG